MYFPTSAARQLATQPALPGYPSDPVVALVPGPHKFLFCTLTRNGIAVWSVRPSALMALLTRTPTSLLTHGDNLDAWWSPDGSRIVVKTSDSYLVLVSVEFKFDRPSYATSQLPANGQRSFLAGPGEGIPLYSVSLHFEGVIRVDATLMSVSPRKTHVLFSTKDPPTIQQMPWPEEEDHDDDDDNHERQPRRAYTYDTWVLNDMDFAWLVDADVFITNILHSKAMDGEAWITSDGRAYLAGLQGDDFSIKKFDNQRDSEEREYDSDHGTNQLHWHGTCIHDFQTPKWVQKQKRVEPEETNSQSFPEYDEPRRATAIAINNRFSLIAIGLHGGGLQFTNFPSEEGILPKSQTIEIPNLTTHQGPVTSLEWSSDGYVLAVGWQSGWAVFSVGGKCLASAFGLSEQVDRDKFQDLFMFGVRDLFWGPGNFELFMLSTTVPPKQDGQLFVIPFAKSATTGQLSPDNTRYAFLQMDDRALVYRGADQPDLSVINPESDVWQRIKIPQRYLALNWPIRYSSLSSDGRLIAIAGRRGLCHYSSASGRWKTFADEEQEQHFAVRGGLLWFHHVLVAAVEVAKSYQLRLYSRDMELSGANILYREVLNSPVIILSLVDNSLLVYTADNTLHHYLIVPTADSIKLHHCASITFNGVISAPSAVRMLSWMIPKSQKEMGDPVDDLAVATVLMVVGGQLVLLRPRKSAASEEVKYDIQVFADRIEFCWIHLRGVGALENSLWAYDAQCIRVWLNALSIDASHHRDAVVEHVKESVMIPLEFYPLSVLMDKGIIIGVEHEIAARSNLPFVLFRQSTSSRLFLQYILLHHLENGQVKEAVVFASNYQNLVFFAHALEMLLHTVVESDIENLADKQSDDESKGVLTSVIEFLDHFDVCLDVVVGCARKTEMTRWRYLFNAVGSPKSLFEKCLSLNRLKTAGSYLLVLNNLEQLDENHTEAVRLLTSAIEAKEWQLCREFLRFLHSIDDTGDALRRILSQIDHFNLDAPTLASSVTSESSS